MTPERHGRLEEICLGALQRDPAGRAAFIAETCAGDEALRRDVEALLAHAEDAEHFMERPALEIAAATFARGLSPIGRQIGPYTVVSALGSGGMGDVYRARDTSLHRDVAIKILPPFVGLDADRRARFDREARLLASLNHSHIAAIYELEQFDGMPVLVLELVEGETLAHRVTRGPLPLNDVIGFGRHITDALEAAHEKGIVHRDLKPANIKVTPDGMVKVLDFGLAKALATESGTNMQASAESGLTAARTPVVLGTPAYMSPEQAQGLAVDKRTDIWAFGCVLYEMLTGTPAFQGTTRLRHDGSGHRARTRLACAAGPYAARSPAAVAPLSGEGSQASPRRYRRCSAGTCGRLVPEAPLRTTRQHGAWLPWSLAGLVLIAAMVILFVYAPERPTGVQPLRLQVPLPDSAGRDTLIFMSPDGRSLASSCRRRGPPAAISGFIRSLLADGRSCRTRVLLPEHLMVP